MNGGFIHLMMVRLFSVSSNSSIEDVAASKGADHDVLSIHTLSMNEALSLISVIPLLSGD
jgi:hypothetical protein